MINTDLLKLENIFTLSLIILVWLWVHDNFISNRINADD